MFSFVPSGRVEETRQPQANTRDQLRFPLALKRARLARQLKQEMLAARLHVKLRTLVSWETGTRLPSVGMVALLSLLLTGDLGTNNDLFLAYIADDLARQADSQEDDEFRAYVLSALQQLSQLQTRDRGQEQEGGLRLSLLGDQSGADEQARYLDDQGTQRPGETTGNLLQQLFTVLETLRNHPELISVAQDFLHEMVPG